MNDSVNRAPFYEQYCENIVSDKVEMAKLRNWVYGHKTSLAVAIALSSAAYTIANSPYDELKETVSDSSWVLGGVVASEVLWLGGAATMLAGAGKGLRLQDFKDLRSNFAEKAKASVNNKLFKAGFTINVVGALSQATILSAGIFKEAPLSAYGLLAIPAADLATTLVTRKIIFDSINDGQD